MRTNILSTSILALGVAFTLACGTPSDQAQSPGGEPAPPPVETFKITTLTWVGYAPIYLAQEKGFFEGIEVDIKRIDDTAARRAALTSGNTHASVDIVDSFTNAAAAGLPAKVVLKLDDSMGGDGIVAKNDIGSIAELEGRSVAYPEGQPSHFFLLALLEQAGIAPGDIESKPMEADQAGAAFVSGSVDAAVTWEPWLTKASSLPDGKVLTTSRETPGLIVDVFTVRSDYLEAHPDVVEAFAKGWFQAVEFYRSNPTEAIPIMAKALDLEQAEFEQMVKGVQYSDLASNKAFFSAPAEGPSPFHQLVTKASDIWFREGVITTAVQPAAIDGSQTVMSLQP